MRKLLFGFGLLAGLATASQCQAQAFGARTLGGGTTAPTTGGAFGSNTTNGQFATGGSSVNNAMGGNNGANGASGSGLSNGMNNNGSGMSGMLGQAATVGQNSYARQRQGQFVGADRNDGTNPQSQAQSQVNMAANTAMFSQLTQRMRQQQQQLQRNQQQGQNGQQKPLRIPMRLPLNERGTLPVSTTATAAISRRLTKLPGLGNQSSIEVLTVGQTAILRGQVATDSDRELAAEIVRLEPGVMDVKNELVVGQGATRAAESRPSVREF